MTVPPLTSLYTPAPSCLSTFVWALVAPSGNGPLVLGPAPTPSQCFPSSWSPDPSFFYSPGICPSGYAPACSSLNTYGAGTETVVTCCPSFYSCQTRTTYSNDPWDSAYSCTSVLTIPSGGTVDWTRWSAGAIATTQSNTLTSAYTFNVNAYSVQVRFQQTDQAVLSAASAGSTSSSSSSSSSSSNSSTSAQDTGTSSASSHKLSVGAQAGIGVSVSVFILALVALGACLVLRRRKHRNKNSTSGNMAYKNGPQYVYPGVYGQQELEASQRPSELDAQHVVRELSTDWNRGHQLSTSSTLGSTPIAAGQRSGYK